MIKMDLNMTDAELDLNPDGIFEGELYLQGSDDRRLPARNHFGWQNSFHQVDDDTDLTVNPREPQSRRLEQTRCLLGPS